MFLYLFFCNFFYYFIVSRMFLCLLWEKFCINFFPQLNVNQSAGLNLHRNDLDDGTEAEQHRHGTEDQQTGQSIKSNQVKSKQIESINKSHRDNQSNPAQSSQVNQYHNHQFNSGVISSRHQAHSQTNKTTCRIINKTVNTENAQTQHRNYTDTAKKTYRHGTGNAQTLYRYCTENT